MARVKTIVAALVLLVGTAYADTFTGRYVIESRTDQGVGISGFIDFVDAPSGTSSFNLAAASAFGIVASGPGLSTLVYSNTQGIVDADDVIFFDAALGAPVLNPLGLPGVRRWQGKGDLDGQADLNDAIELRTANNSVSWLVWEGGLGSFDFDAGGPASTPAWYLVRAVPEPGSLVLLGSAAVFLRRRRKT